MTPLKITKMRLMRVISWSRRHDNCLHLESFDLYAQLSANLNSKPHHHHVCIFNLRNELETIRCRSQVYTVFADSYKSHLCKFQCSASFCHQFIALFRGSRETSFDYFFCFILNSSILRLSSFTKATPGDFNASKKERERPLLSLIPISFKSI